MKKYEFENLRADILADYHLAFQMTSEILVLELIHRVATCLFEVRLLELGSSRIAIERGKWLDKVKGKLIGKEA